MVNQMYNHLIPTQYTFLLAKIIYMQMWIVLDVILSNTRQLYLIHRNLMYWCTNTHWWKLNIFRKSNWFLQDLNNLTQTMYFFLIGACMIYSSALISAESLYSIQKLCAICRNCYILGVAKTIHELMTKRYLSLSFRQCLEAVITVWYSINFFFDQKAILL